MLTKLFHYKKKSWICFSYLLIFIILTFCNSIFSNEIRLRRKLWEAVCVHVPVCVQEMKTVACSWQHCDLSYTARAFQFPEAIPFTLTQPHLLSSTFPLPQTLRIVAKKHTCCTILNNINSISCPSLCLILSIWAIQHWVFSFLSNGKLCPIWSWEILFATFSPLTNSICLRT